MTTEQDDSIRCEYCSEESPKHTQNCPYTRTGTKPAYEAVYEPPTIEEWHEIVRALCVYGLDAHLEGGGAGATYAWINLPDGRVVLVGDQDETWCGNVYASQEAFENGEEFTTFGTDVPTKFDGTDRYHDPESIAEAVFTALRSC